MTYHKYTKVKAEHNCTSVSPHKISTKSAVRNSLLWNDIHFLIQFHFFVLNDVHQVEADSFRSWRGWLIIWRWKWLGSSTKLPGGLDLHWSRMKGELLELNGLDAAHMTHWSGFEYEKELLFIFMKRAWDNDHPGGWSLWKITWN